LAAIVWSPPAGEPVRFGVLHVPPAGDEMNKSRRMVAMQARELARRGGVVAIVDLRGTGDSAGEHGDATWKCWGEDVEAAWAWLETRIAPLPGILWGMRLGGLLAAELVASGRIDPAMLLLWQPVTAGRTFFGQWLRAASAQQLTGRSENADAKSLRRMLADGSPVEIGGYALHPRLVSGAEAVDLSALLPPRCPVVWRETTIAHPPAISPASARVQEAWSGADAHLDFVAVHGPSFWASQELAEAPALIASTTDALVERLAIAERVH
jgi:exosortase A-associated hydrolase 2